jgi:hypothetical protein
VLRRADCANQEVAVRGKLELLMLRIVLFNGNKKPLFNRCTGTELRGSEAADQAAMAILHGTSVKSYCSSNSRSDNLKAFGWIHVDCGRNFPRDCVGCARFGPGTTRAFPQVRFYARDEERWKQLLVKVRSTAEGLTCGEVSAAIAREHRELSIRR